MFISNFWEDTVLYYCNRCNFNLKQRSLLAEYQYIIWSEIKKKSLLILVFNCNGLGNRVGSSSCIGLKVKPLCTSLEQKETFESFRFHSWYTFDSDFWFSLFHKLPLTLAPIPLQFKFDQALGIRQISVSWGNAVLLVLTEHKYIYTASQGA